MTFDEARARYPLFGLAIYAYEPGGLVTLEVLIGDETHTFTGATQQAALDLAFPPESQIPEPAIEPEPEPPAHNVFD